MASPDPPHLSGISPILAPIGPRVDMRRGAAWMMLSLVGFTGMALLIKYLGLQRGVSPWLSLFFRALVGLVVVWIVYAPRGRVDFRRALFTRLLVTRGVLGAIGTACYYRTLPELGAGKATLISNTWVIWSAIMAVFMLGELLSWRKIIGMGFAIVGITFLLGLQGGDFTQVGRFEMVAVIGAFIAAGVVVVIRQLTLTETSGTIFASQCAYTGLLALPFILRLPLPSLADTGLLIAAAVSAALGQLAMTEGFRFLPVSTGGAFQILLPLSITVASMALFKEPFSGLQGVGAVLILVGCYQTVTARR
ncbi:MAG: DMT family transporter [Verrucomicrobiales bacterium]|nr:DMT family transporter [Verrucomicrobiales bacterium]